MSEDHSKHDQSPSKNQEFVSESHEEKKAETAQQSNVNQQDQECKTPTSCDHKIPPIQSCPPTPRKKVQVFHPKRKLPKMEFFESTHSDEVESFFESSLEVSSSVDSSQPNKKIRRCRSY